MYRTNSFAAERGYKSAMRLFVKSLFRTLSSRNRVRVVPYIPVENFLCSAQLEWFWAEKRGKTNMLMGIRTSGTIKRVFLTSDRQMIGLSDRRSEPTVHTSQTWRRTSLTSEYRASACSSLRWWWWWGMDVQRGWWSLRWFQGPAVQRRPRCRCRWPALEQRVRRVYLYSTH